MAHTSPGQPSGLFRAINRRICELIAEIPRDASRPHKTRDDGRRELICECGDVNCVSPASLEVSEFEAICNTEHRIVLGDAHFASG